MQLFIKFCRNLVWIRAKLDKQVPVPTKVFKIFLIWSTIPCNEIHIDENEPLKIKIEINFKIKAICCIIFFFILMTISTLLVLKFC